MTETFEQKRRNRPIKITQIAIDKVPLAHIDGFTEEEDLFIQNMHKRLLLTSMELNDSKETGKIRFSLSTIIQVPVLSRV